MSLMLSTSVESGARKIHHGQVHCAKPALGPVPGPVWEISWENLFFLVMQNHMGVCEVPIKVFSCSEKEFFEEVFSLT